MQSMTGFAQGRFTFPNFAINISFKSLNYRYLDVNFRGTGITPVSEKLIKEVIKDKVFRGKIEIIFDLFEKDQRKWDIQFNEFLLEEILNKILHFSKKYKDTMNLSLDSFLKIPMIFHLDYAFDSFTEEDMSHIRQTVTKVFSDFMESRRIEGEYIQRDILACVGNIEENIKYIEQESEKVEREIFNTYKEKIKKFLDSIDMDEKRILQEAAIAAEKSCINEEINRLKIHCNRLVKLIENRNILVKGREADFLAQEMQRESHTIASKTGSMTIHEKIILIRREIEKIKQQIQNVE